jgi:homoprotocatechuate degradation regulator HpaR
MPLPPDAARALLRDFSRSLPMLLLRSHQAVMAEFRPVLRAHGITEQQWRVLRALSTAPALRISQVAELTLISGPSLTRILKALEQRGLVDRRAEPGDQRAARISMTASARRLIATVAPHSEARYRSIARRLGERDMAQLYRLLADLPDKLGARRDARRRPAA